MFYLDGGETPPCDVIVYVHNFFVLAARDNFREFEKPSFSGGIHFQ